MQKYSEIYSLYKIRTKSTYIGVLLTIEVPKDAKITKKEKKIVQATLKTIKQQIKHGLKSYLPCKVHKVKQTITI